jgi:hypothetical protein
VRLQSKRLSPSRCKRQWRPGISAKWRWRAG